MTLHSHAASGKAAERVLVVEDDLTTRHSFVSLLTANGFHAVTAENGPDALEQLRRVRPCVVLLDLTMPLLDAPGFVEAAQSHSEFLPPVPIICVSGLPDARERAQRLGLSDCLPKPVDPEVLLRCVLQHCQSKWPV